MKKNGPGTVCSLDGARPYTCYMALHVTLVRDPLKGGGSLKPRVVQTDTVNMDSLLGYMATDTALEETDMRAAVSRLHEALLFYLSRGEKVATPFGTFHLSARGTYLDGETPRVETRNLGINFRPSPGLLYDLRNSTKIVMEGTSDRKLPSITSVINVEAPDPPNEGKAGHLLKMQGNRLSFDPADEEVGVCRVATDGTDHRMAVYSRAGSARVDFKLAKVPVGTYTLEIRTRPSQKDVWVGINRDAFTVRS